MNDLVFEHSINEAEFKRALELATQLIEELSKDIHSEGELESKIKSARCELSTILRGGETGEPGSQHLLDQATRATRIASHLYAWQIFVRDKREAGSSRRPWQVRRRKPVRVEPLSGVLVREEAEGLRQWRTTDNDPQFLLHGLEAFAGAWVELTFQLEVVSGSGHPTLYVDAGNGFSEATAIRIARPRRRGARSTALLFVPEAIVAVRLDPISNVGSFSLRHIGVRAVLRPIVATRMLLSIAFAGRIKELFVPDVNGQEVGFRHRMVRTYMRIAQGNTYEDWIGSFEPAMSEAPRFVREAAAWRRRPLISVVLPVYNTPDHYLKAAIDSVLAQSYRTWELCIADDGSTNSSVRTILSDYASSDDRIKVVFRSTNGRIAAATNSALELATGEFIALLDHDDQLHPFALHYLARSILEHPSAGIIYTDEDKIDGQGRRFAPYFKSEFNYQLFLSHNMICHLGCYRRDLVERVGGMRSEFDGSQDYDLALRIIELIDRGQIIHVPRVLYHWRAIEGSTSLRADAKPYAHIAAMRSIQDHLDRQSVRAEVMEAPECSDMNRIRYLVPAQPPSVCVVIPTRDRLDLLERCVSSIRFRTIYRNYSICVIDNGSMEPETLAYLREQQRSGLEVIRDDSPFNFSALNNRAARTTKAEFLVLMNNDIEVLSPDWIDEMVGHAVQPNIGAVGARLWYPDKRLQHGGIILGIGGVAGHSHKFLPKGHPGYFARAVIQQDFSAVTAACLMIRRTTYLDIGGLDESFCVAFNDVDFCLRLVQRGLRNVWTPYAEFIHHESATRGPESSSPEKLARFLGEMRLMKTRWGSTLYEDPAYSPNLTLDSEDFGLAWPPRVGAGQIAIKGHLDGQVSPS